MQELHRTPVTDNTRERIEQLLLAGFDAVRPLEPSHLEAFQPFKSGSFMPSVLGFMLYANGYSLRGTSRYCRNGLIYADGKTLFGIGIFRKTMESDTWHIMISGPWGEDGFTKVDTFIRKVRTLVGGAEIYVRHLSEAEYAAFLSHGYVSVEASPWCETAPSEDETYNHKRIRIEEIIGYDAKGRFQIKTLQTEEHRGFRVKARLVFNRFGNFLERNQLRLEIYDYSLAHRDTAESLVRHHFEILRNPVGSTPEDYLSLINFDPADGKDQYFGKIGFLEGAGGVRIPALLFIGEKTSEDTVALYATFANRDPHTLEPSMDATGFSAISQYSYLILFKMLLDRGVRWANVGGSETEELNKFKRQLGAQHESSYWAVAMPQLHAARTVLVRQAEGGLV